MKKINACVTMVLFFSVVLAACSIGAPRPTPTATKRPTETPSALPTLTPKPTATKTPRPTPAKAPLTYKGTPCVSWVSITKKDVEKHLCVFGIIYNFAPASDKWYTVEFSAAPDSFRIYDFNYYYLIPLRKGDCIVIYGRIRDWGTFLIIAPDFKSDKDIGVVEAAYCE